MAGSLLRRLNLRESFHLAFPHNPFTHCDATPPYNENLLYPQLEGDVLRVWAQVKNSSRKMVDSAVPGFQGLQAEISP